MEGGVQLVPHWVCVGAHRFIFEVDLLHDHVACPLEDLLDEDEVLVCLWRLQLLLLAKLLDSGEVEHFNCGAPPLESPLMQRAGGGGQSLGMLFIYFLGNFLACVLTSSFNSVFVFFLTAFIGAEFLQ